MIAQEKEKPHALQCVACDRLLTEDEIEDPGTDEDGDLLCYDCELEANQGPCPRCEEWGPNAERSLEPGHVTGVWQELDGLHAPVPPGYYRVERWPIYADGMIEGFVYDDALTRVAALDAQGQRVAADEDAYPAGALCLACQRTVLRGALVTVLGQRTALLSAAGG